jgi:hypothetical protein
MNPYLDFAFDLAVVVEHCPTPPRLARQAGVMTAIQSIGITSASEIGDPSGCILYLESGNA